MKGIKIAYSNRRKNSLQQQVVYFFMSLNLMYFRLCIPESNRQYFLILLFSFCYFKHHKYNLITLNVGVFKCSSVIIATNKTDKINVKTFNTIGIK